MTVSVGTASSVCDGFAEDLRHLEGVMADDMWNYYCEHMDLMSVVNWIDTQFSSVNSSSASASDWPATEPVSADMIDKLHTCPARVTDYLLDRLAG